MSFLASSAGPAAPLPASQSDMYGSPSNSSPPLLSSPSSPQILSSPSQFASEEIVLTERIVKAVIDIDDTLFATSAFVRGDPSPTLRQAKKMWAATGSSVIILTSASREWVMQLRQDYPVMDLICSRSTVISAAEIHRNVQNNEKWKTLAFRDIIYPAVLSSALRANRSALVITIGDSDYEHSAASIAPQYLQTRLTVKAIKMPSIPKIEQFLQSQKIVVSLLSSPMMLWPESLYFDCTSHYTVLEYRRFTLTFE